MNAAQHARAPDAAPLRFAAQVKRKRIRSGRGDCPRFDLRKSASFGILPLWTSRNAHLN